MTATAVADPHVKTARNSATVGTWTLVSRLTGVLRVVVVGAVLGPTFFANTFQAGYVVPSLVFTAIAGPVLAMVLVPALVRALERAGPAAARDLLARVACVLVAIATLVCAVLLVASPIVAASLTFGAPAADATRGRELATAIVVLVAPQVVLYLLIGLAIAAQRARGRFALAAAAPAVENVALVAVVLLAGMYYGTGLETGEVSTAFAVALALGSTAAVALHAVLQLAGATRCGLPVAPWRGRWWRGDPEVLEVCRRLRGSLAVAACPAAALYLLLVLAGTVPGGVFAVQVAAAVFYAAVHIGGGAVSTAALPALAISVERADPAGFATGWRAGLRYVVIVALPVGALIAAFAGPGAELLSQGAMTQTEVVASLAGCLVVVALAQLVGGVHDLGRQALFARSDHRSPALASQVAFVVTLLWAAAALALPAGSGRLIVLVVAVLAGELAGAAVILIRLHTVLRPERMWAPRDLAPSIVATLPMLPPLGIGAWIARDNPGVSLAELGLLATCAAVAVAAYAVALRHGQRRQWQLRQWARDRVASGTGPVILGTVAAATAAGVFAALVGPRTAASTVVGCGCLALVAVAARWPVAAVYLYLGTLPFLAGIGRGMLLPLVRPNEALLALLLLGVGLRVGARLVAGHHLGLRRTPVDLPLAAFAVLSTVWPLTWILLRGRAPEPIEFAAVLPICKLVALLVLVRLAVSTHEQLVRCIRLVVWPASAVALIAILQTLNVAPVISILQTLWTPEEGDSELTNRGTSTLSSSIATGDYLVIGAILLLCCSVRGLLHARERLILGLVLGAGILASGQFSTWIAAAVAGILALHQIPDVRARALRLLPLLPVVAVIGAPAFLGRVQGLGSEGLPVSWLGRWDNLTNFYLPTFDPLTALLGFSPSSVLDAPETWREVIYLEAGYLDLLWIGGLPLLIGFAFLSLAVLRRSRLLASRPGPLGAFAAALAICWAVVLVLTVLDPHLTQRGTGDLLFTMTAVVTGSLSAGSLSVRTT